MQNRRQMEAVWRGASTNAMLATHPVVARVGAEDYARSARVGERRRYGSFAPAANRDFTEPDRLCERIVSRIGRLELQQRRLEGSVGRLISENNDAGFLIYGTAFGSPAPWT